jgi:hypothetical protein
MAGLTSILLGSQIAMTAASAYGQSKATKAQGRYEQQVAEQNATLANMQAEDTLAQGAKAATQHHVQTKGLIGAQRAVLASQGIDANTGSALDVQADTAALGALDELTIRNNAWRSAWGYKVQASQYTAQGQFALLSAKNKARNTLLTGGAQIANTGLTAYGLSRTLPQTPRY